MILPEKLGACDPANDPCHRCVGNWRQKCGAMEVRASAASLERERLAQALADQSTTVPVKEVVVYSADASLLPTPGIPSTLDGDPHANEKGYYSKESIAARIQEQE